MTETTTRQITDLETAYWNGCEAAEEAGYPLHRLREAIDQGAESPEVRAWLAGYYSVVHEADMPKVGE